MNRVEKDVEKDVSMAHNTTTSATTTTSTSPTMTAPMAGGFSTGRGKKVNASEASIHHITVLHPTLIMIGIKKAQLMMNQVEKEVEREVVTAAPASDSTTKAPTSDMAAPMGGFSTGRGKKVNVSEASILHCSFRS